MDVEDDHVKYCALCCGRLNFRNSSRVYSYIIFLGEFERNVIHSKLVLGSVKELKG